MTEGESGRKKGREKESERERGKEIGRGSEGINLEVRRPVLGLALLC